jgi:molybdopterin synthase sulfur carrier subunit
MVAVRVPSALRIYCEDRSELTLSGVDVRGLLNELKRIHPPIYQRVCDETGAVRPHINLFVNDAFLHDREGFDTPLREDDIVTIMPAVSGG